jgi:hypothetical protein
MVDDNAQHIEWYAELPFGAPLAFAGNALQLTSFGRANFEAGMWAFTAYVKSALAWQREIAEFTSSQLDKTTDFGRRLIDAKHTSEAVKIQAEYLRRAANDYVEGALRLMERGAAASREIVTPLRERADEAAREVEERPEEVRVGKAGGKSGGRVEVAAS